MVPNGRDGGSAQFTDPRAFGLFKAAYSVKETLELLSIGRTKFYELVDQGDLKITKLGSKSLVYVTEIVALLVKLRGAAAAN
jgi:excisionase family DNA binding protein